MNNSDKDSKIAIRDDYPIEQTREDLYVDLIRTSEGIFAKINYEIYGYTVM